MTKVNEISIEEQYISQNLEEKLYRFGFECVGTGCGTVEYQISKPKAEVEKFLKGLFGKNYSDQVNWIDL